MSDLDHLLKLKNTADLVQALDLGPDEFNALVNLGLRAANNQNSVYCHNLKPPALAAQSRLGRGADGLPARLDAHRWPARRGEAQHDWEPPRTTTERQHRAQRLKALGNAVVPQVVYPLALAIREWLDEQAAAGARADAVVSEAAR